MATDTRAHPWNNLTVATFRAWGQAVGDALVACGLVKCTNVEAAGQINWATVTYTPPMTPDTTLGFEVFKFADALQATAPVYIQLDYGGGATSTGGSTPGTRPRINLRVGTGVNAATGALTGVLSDTMVLSAADWDGNTTNTQTMYTCGASGRCAQILGHDNAHPNFIIAWGVARTKNADGTDNTDGVIIQTHSAAPQHPSGAWSEAGACQHQVLLFTGIQADTAPKSYHDAPPTVGLGPRSAATGVVGADIAAFPWVVPSSRGHENPSMNFLSGWAANFINGAQQLIQMYGVGRNYRAFGNAGIGAALYTDDGTDTQLLAKAQTAWLMRWE